MEEVIKIEGGKMLEGSIKVSGAKNATVALIPACVLATDIVKIVGIPNISDVRSLKEISCSFSQSRALRQDVQLGDVYSVTISFSGLLY